MMTQRAAEPGALHVVPCAQPSVRPRRESEACHAAAPHAPGTNVAARPRWHRRRRPRTRRAHFAARPVHVSGLAGFLVEVGERPRRGRARRSRVDESISGLALGQCGYAQPPASVVSALRAPPSHAPHTTFFLSGGGRAKSRAPCRQRRSEAYQPASFPVSSRTATRCCSEGAADEEGRHKHRPHPPESRAKRRG